MEDPRLRQILDALGALEGATTDQAASQASVDDLSEALASSDSFGSLYSEGVRRLRGLCRMTNLVPTSCRVSRDITEMTTEPIMGHFSDVYSGMLDGRRVAIKVLRVHRDQLEQVKKAYLHELVVWQCLRSPNIVPFIGTSPRSDISLVSEWMPGGTVSAFLRDNPGHDRRALVLHIMDGLTFMHSLDVVHGDLKAANVLVDGANRARLTDFGLAVVIHATMTSISTGGSLRWTAPELLDPERYVTDIEEKNRGRATKQSDMYALAITTWEIFGDQIPFPTIRDYRVIVMVVDGERPPRLPELTSRGLNNGIWDWMVQCWNALPSERPTLPAQSNTTRLFSATEQPNNLHRMILNNWLQVHGGVSRLLWNAAPTGPQHDITWTASALIDGTIYATGTGRTQSSAKEMAARLTRQRLEVEMAARFG